MRQNSLPMRERVIYGTTVMNNPIFDAEEPLIHFPGTCYADGRSFSIDERIFSKHLLLLGGSGCGKTNTFLFAMKQMLRNLKEEDVAIVFDTKGEFYEKFYRPGDYVIGNSPEFLHKSHAWNIFDEILADGDSEYAIQTNAREIAAALFHGRGSSSQPFFCNAAKELFYAVLIYFIRQSRANPQLWLPRLNNLDLKKALTQFQAQDYVNIFNKYQDLKYMQTYIGNGSSNQALGVFGELNSMIAEFFVGNLAQNYPDRKLSMRNAIRRRGGKIIFIEYDLAMGEILTPVYRLLVDQALKEALSRQSSVKDKKFHCYLFVDEFKLLPKLQHIDDALNFGRGLGVRVMAGIQSINQLYDIYGREKGEVLVSGFGSLLAFRTNDNVSREYVGQLLGPNVTVYQYVNELDNTVYTEQRQGSTVEQWDQLNLGVGQAIVSMGDHLPFLYQFAEYKE
ncbi:MAG: type IV secretion system DNA-binding domain-containing protein [Oscillospiraceae bacterium]|nr:type IV secretion system DNA-binding domain-containing protein [Oscillospiraceae bacterium]